jgi:aminomethyltransferase
MELETTMAAPAGYEALRSTAAWLDLSARGKIKASGEDRARLLHAMTTNQVQQLTPGTGCYAYFLTAQGRILADANILCRPDYFLLDTEPETRDKLLHHLDSYIIADDVTLEDLTAETATIAVEGPQAEAILLKLGAPAPEQDYASTEWGERLVVRATYVGGQGFFILTPAGDKDRFIQELASAGVQRGSEEAFRVVRIENGRPRYGEDITERYLAQETNQPRAINYQKGCYLGQEIVERVRSRGQVHRVLMPLTIDTSEPPLPGTKLQPPPAANASCETPGCEPTAAGEQIAIGSNAGEISSAAFSPALGKVVALAYVRVEHARPGLALSLAGTQTVTVGRGAS